MQERYQQQRGIKMTAANTSTAFIQWTCCMYTCMYTPHSTVTLLWCITPPQRKYHSPLLTSLPRRESWSPETLPAAQGHPATQWWSQSWARQAAWLQGLDGPSQSRTRTAVDTRELSSLQELAAPVHRLQALFEWWLSGSRSIHILVYYHFPSGPTCPKIEQLFVGCERQIPDGTPWRDFMQLSGLSHTQTVM